jgi:hypothetical protein
MLRYPLMLLVVPVLLTGCASTQQLKHERDVLAAELSVERDRVAQLKEEKRNLEERVASLEGIGNVLQKEKARRVEDAIGVRREVRGFVKAQVDALSAFSQRAQLLDYLGGEIIERSMTDGQNVLLVDDRNIIPAPATGLGGRFLSKGRMPCHFCVLRGQDQTLAVVWMSGLFNAPGAGVHDVDFKIPVGVEKGDRIGLLAPAECLVPFDEGTGKTIVFPGPVRPGQRIDSSKTGKPSTRTYSFGIIGFLGNGGAANQ